MIFFSWVITCKINILMKPFPFFLLFIVISFFFLIYLSNSFFLSFFLFWLSLFSSSFLLFFNLSLTFLSFFFLSFFHTLFYLALFSLLSFRLFSLHLSFFLSFCLLDCHFSFFLVSCFMSTFSFPQSFRLLSFFVPSFFPIFFLSSSLSFFLSPKQQVNLDFITHDIPFFSGLILNDTKCLYGIFLMCDILKCDIPNVYPFTKLWLGNKCSYSFGRRYHSSKNEILINTKKSQYCLGH